MRFQGHRRRRQKIDGFSNNKRSNCSSTHPLKSAILISRASRSEVRGVGDMPRAMPSWFVSYIVRSDRLYRAILVPLFWWSCIVPAIELILVQKKCQQQMQ
jgi:hypothetical protein